ncbi:hypothetical protein ABVT39_010700 [Epinephelus coioides]
MAPAVKAERAALLQRLAKTLIPKMHRIYNGATITHPKAHAAHRKTSSRKAGDA